MHWPLMFRNFCSILLLGEIKSSNVNLNFDLTCTSTKGYFIKHSNIDISLVGKCIGLYVSFRICLHTITYISTLFFSKVILYLSSWKLSNWDIRLFNFDDRPVFQHRLKLLFFKTWKFFFLKTLSLSQNQTWGFL